MAVIKKDTKQRGENMKVKVRRPIFLKAKPENIKQAGSKRDVYIPPNRLLYIFTNIVLKLYAYM